MSPPDRPALGFISEGDEPPVRRKTDVPFHPAPETINQAVQAELDLLAAVRGQRVQLEQVRLELGALRASIAQAQSDVLRACDAATYSAGQSVIIAKRVANNDAKLEAVVKAVAEVGSGVRQLLERGSNGHG